MQLRLCQAGTLFFGVIFSTQMFAIQVIKKSNSGICHPPQSSWYERTKNYAAFESLEGCVAAGGRLTKGVSLGPSSGSEALSKSVGISKYKRSKFGSNWTTKNCRDTRARLLVEMSTLPVRFATDKGCLVTSGRWVSSWTGNVLNAGDIDIDHIIALSWAWHRGAATWTKDKRVEFANDPVNLVAVEASLNRSKSDQGPDQWLPPGGQCGYVARFYRIVKLYRLEPRPAENEWIRAFLNDCRS
jgi:hypothetical protein